MDFTIEINLPILPGEQVVDVITSCPRYNPAPEDSELATARRVDLDDRLEEVLKAAFTGDDSDLYIEDNNWIGLLLYGDGSYVPATTEQWLLTLASLGGTGTFTVFDGRRSYRWELHDGGVDYCVGDVVYRRERQCVRRAS
ncbi:hypothetical protein [Gordonia alkanivorans]|uniref:hypothetical protein n=1 Tax=Gordonia alkanivorans TaxID=84096 RepID=UPI0004B956EB|nr:hypothetical protein [Gordonia alkanivorans]